MPETTTVKKGESWASIAGRLYGGDQRMMGELMRANGGTLNLKPGQKLVIPNKVSNPFVSFAQAAYGAGTIEENKPGASQRTADLISGMKGGADWLAQATAAMGVTQPGKTPPGAMLSGQAGNPQQIAQAQFQQNALNQRMSSKAPDSRVAKENAGITSTPRAGVPPQASVFQGNGVPPATPYSKPSSFPSQPKGTTRYLPGQQNAQPLTAGPSFANGGLSINKNAWFMQGATPVPGIIGALGSFQNVGANAPNPRDAQLAPATTPGAQPVTQPTTPASPKTATGGNNLSQSGMLFSDTNSPEYTQYIGTVFNSSANLNRMSIVDAIQVAVRYGGANPENADTVSAKLMTDAGFVLDHGIWSRQSQVEQDATPPPPNNSGTGTLDFRNMDISTLVQLGFYDAPTQPTFSSTGRDNTGSSEPAPVSSYGLVGGTSWRISP